MSPSQNTPYQANRSATTGDALPTARRFARTRRLFSRSVDVLVIVIVVMVGWRVGREILDWWSVEPDDVAVHDIGAATGDSIAWGQAGTPIVLEFGASPYRIQRQQFVGTEDAARNQLLGLNRQSVQVDVLPTTTPTSAETAILRSLSEKQPLDQGDQWRVYELKRPTLMVVGIRSPALGDSKDENGDAVTSRIICWSLAVPQGEDQWLLYSFTLANADATASVPEWKINLPDGCRRIMSMGDVDGGLLVTFEGTGDAKTLCRSFDGTLVEQGWVIATPWQNTGTHWNARYRWTPSPAGAQLDILFYRTRDDRYAGIAQINPIRSDSLTKDGS